MGLFIFNNKSSEDFGLVVQAPPVYSFPDRDISSTRVPGRNGDIIIDNGSFKNVPRSYIVGVKYKQSTGQYETFERILDWLNSKKGGYAVLEDSYDPEVYRMASFQLSGDINDYHSQAGAMTITFNCKPQRFLKMGDNETVYMGKQFHITNNSGFESAPLIAVDNISTDLSNVLMLSIIDKNSKANTIITFSQYTGSLLIDSAEQTVVDAQGNDQYDKLSLNGTKFPALYGGKNTFSFGKYIVDSVEIPSYSNKILSKQDVCVSEYKTYAALESTNQEKIFVRSLNSIINNKQKSYVASAVQAMMNSTSEVYTFRSFNAILAESSKSYTFTGTAEDNLGTYPSWVDVIDASDGTITLKAKVNGFYAVATKDKKLRFVPVGAIIYDKLSPNSINTVTYYEVIETTDPASKYNVTNAGKQYRLLASYTDTPEWLMAEIEYTNNSPTRLLFSIKAKGYYWTDKSGLFDKASWKYSQNATKTELMEITWDTSKAAFATSSGLFGKSTTAEFTFKYSNSEPTILPEYKPVTSESIDDRGVKTVTMLNPVYFLVKDISENKSLTNISITSTKTGYFSYKTDKMEEASVWTYRAAGEVIATNVAGTVGFEVNYLDTIPNSTNPDISYKEEEGWPEWLDPLPVNADGSYITVLEPQSVYFKVLQSSLYRQSKGPEDDTGESHSGWKNINENGVLITDDLKDAETSYYIYKIGDIPTLYDHNRRYTLNGSVLPNGTLPNWLSTEVSDFDTTTGLPNKISYTSKAAGYFKWESNTSWLRKEAGQTLLDTAGKDDTTFYYMEYIPAYTEDDITDFNMKDLFTMAVIQDNSTGNPKEIQYTITTTGYYRVNNATDWRYILEGSNLTISKIGETNKIYHLRQTNDDLSTLKTKIKPRWWML